MDTTAEHRAPARLRATPSWLITQTATHASRLASEAFDTVGARRYHYALLAALEEFGPASQAELGRRCAIDRSYVVEAVNGLAENGMAVRTPDPADGRRNIITITEAGERELRKISERLAEAQDKLLAPLSPAEREQLAQLMARVLDHQTRG
ncbi:MarR family winged helix-turn-helix transcriptional regulator [Streptomyces sp. A3M-1-3]|uniref:MarR family winged helix-turn-helix transcriptional regulator n=1 Tax=Streptomyces sp. A3M-1-3 TaxID=2962044 RepID=UPI0020B63BAA|nr:MarR family winged helix-turn-helix transcriptional regulator [Streptomyces sp. A3M-1-3]MCP3821351.1 MarR family winged helix-turn-helix transcriptional regulator [Streptomyces sp. A3M-1-3]